MRRNHESGEGRVGLFIALVVVGLAVFLGFKIIPVKIEAYEFRETLREECRMAAVRHDDKIVRQRILSKASRMDLPLAQGNLTVRRTNAEMIIAAHYEEPIDLKFMTYVYKFNAEERSPLF